MSALQYFVGLAGSQNYIPIYKIVEITKILRPNSDQLPTCIILDIFSYYALGSNRTKYDRLKDFSCKVLDMVKAALTILFGRQALTRVFYASLEEKKIKIKIYILTLAGGAYSGHCRTPALFDQIIYWKCLKKVLSKGEIVNVVERMNPTNNVSWLWCLSLCPLDTLQVYQGLGQVGLYEPPSIISKSTQKYYFLLTNVMTWL